MRARMDSRLEQEARMTSGGVLAADVGGTFTDVLWMDESKGIHAAKVLSKPDAYVEGIEAGVLRAMSNGGASTEDVARFVHGTTIATNTIISRTGPRVVLVTTLGFRDVLEIARIRTPQLYNLRWEKPPPLVPRDRRLEVRERIGADGEIITALSPDEIQRVAGEISRLNPDAVAICFLNSHANSSHEEMLLQFLRETMANTPISVSSRILPEIGEYERTSTTVVNAYLQPIVGDYLATLNTRLVDARVNCPASCNAVERRNADY